MNFLGCPMNWAHYNIALGVRNVYIAATCHR